MTFFRYLCRYIVGFVFIYSGFVKGIDPLGSTYKFTEYFTVAHVEFLSSFSLVFSILLSTAEFTIGMALVLGLRMRATAWAVLAFMSFFTALTLVLAFFNPVSDCGCFGDAIKLTNWQTFEKNIVLMVFVLVIFILRKKYKNKYKVIGEWVTLGIIAFGFLMVVRYSYYHLPVIDFLPYKTGTDIRASMAIPDGKPKDEYKTTLYYKKDGVVKEFSMDNYPWKDTTWKWVDTKTVLVKEGYKPPIHDFRIIDPEGEDITDHILSDNGYSFLLIAYDLKKTNQGALERIAPLTASCAKGKCSFYAITASPQSEIQKFQEKAGMNFRFCHADETTLKTMIRSNPGLMLVKEGTILGKWAYRDWPDVNEAEKNYLSYIIKHDGEKNESLTKIFLFLILVVTLAAIKIIQLNFDRRG